MYSSLVCVTGMHCFSLLFCILLWCYLSAGEVFFFKQKTAYEMRISDWSSDVCSSDLILHVEQFSILFDKGVLRLGEDLDQRLIVEILQRSDDRKEIGRASCRERVCQYV